MMWIQLRINILRLHGIENRRRLITTSLGLGCINIGRLRSLHFLREIVLLVGKYTVIEFRPLSEEASQRLLHQIHVVLFQVFVNEHTWNANENLPCRRFVRLEDNRPEPGVELLLRNVVLNQLQTIVPKQTGVNTHI